MRNTGRLRVGTTVSLACLGVAATVILASAVDTNETTVAAAELQSATAGGKARATFAKDVAPIFQQKCQKCHHPGTAAPMSLITYAEARPWAGSIKRRVLAREMPPWHVDKTVGIQKFKNDTSLTDEQIATIVAWVDGGAPLGDPKDLPPPLEFQDEDEWHIGKPDLIVSTPEQVVYANGPDYWTYYEVETGLTEDRYIKAVETRASKDGRLVVHHGNTSIIQKEGRPRAAFNAVITDPAQGSFISEYAPGKYGDIFPEGTGRLLRAGSKIRWEMHYHAVGEEITAQLSVGFVFYPKGYVPKHYLANIFPHENDTIDIPPGAVARTDTYYRLPMHARIISYQPHMHIRGKAQCLEAIHLDGQVETLSCINFDFNWHVAYVYKDDVAPLLPAGTMLHLISIHDNTAANRGNPDPTIWVGWGFRSIDDMAAAHIGTEFLTDEEYDRQVAARREKGATSTSARR